MPHTPNQKVKSNDEVLEIIAVRILGKRGQSNRDWVERLKSWEDKDPYIVRDRTLMEIFRLVQSYRGSEQTLGEDEG